jgi:hypothetical protein
MERLQYGALSEILLRRKIGPVGSPFCAVTVEAGMKHQGDETAAWTKYAGELARRATEPFKRPDYHFTLHRASHVDAIERQRADDDG